MAKKKHQSKPQKKTVAASQVSGTSPLSWPVAIIIVAFDAAVLGLLLVLFAGTYFFPQKSPHIAGFATSLSPTPTPIPLFPHPLLVSSPPLLTARAIVVIDDDSSEILYAKAPDERLYPASTTKIMTALVAMKEYQLDDVVAVTNANESVGHKAELVPGDQFTVTDLLYALLLNSGNDAAVTLAQHHPQGYSGFINAMNQTATELGLSNTHFTNASGLENSAHYASVRDLAILTRSAMKEPLFKQIVSTPQYAITSLNSQRLYKLANLNQLLTTVPGVSGVKTGWTELAGECLVTTVNQDNHPLTLVILGSQDRFGETEKLIQWVYQNTRWSTNSSSV